MKTVIQLKAINTKNLLRYYKAERNRFYGGGYWCGCGCGDMIWEARNCPDMESKYTEHKKYLGLIKTILDSREHIITKS